MREQVAAASSAEARADIIKQALAEPNLSEWVWIQFVRDGPERLETVVREATAPDAVPRLSVMPFGENLLPPNPTLYTALPDPLTAFNRLASAFNAIQMDSAREQADLVLMMSAMREQLSMQLNAEPDASIFDYLGVKVAAPLVFASWNAEGAPRGIDSAGRHPSSFGHERDRFERLLGIYQSHLGGSKGALFVAGCAVPRLLPAAIPISARHCSKKNWTKEDSTILRRVTGTRSWGGYHQCITQDVLTLVPYHADTAYVTYLGDRLYHSGPDSMGDLLTRAAKGTTTFATNSPPTSFEDGADAIISANVRLFGRLATEPRKSERKRRVTNHGQVWHNPFKADLPKVIGPTAAEISA